MAENALRFNTLKPAKGSNKAAKRVGRGSGSGDGKTCGRGTKGQKSRSGGYHKVGFEGGQMPLQRRLPKSGFNSRKALVTAEVPLHKLNNLPEGSDVTLEILKQSGLSNRNIKRAKVMLSGSLKHKINLSGIGVTRGARKAIEELGGKLEE